MSRRPALLRSLGFWDATLLVIGCIVGVGIFRTASPIARHLDSPALMLLTWAVGGAISVCGALCYAELAAMFPASGGDYVYLSRIYGRFWGFLFGWTKLFIERTGTIAILGFVFAEYLRRVVPYAEGTLRWVAGAAILLLTAVNIAGLRWGTYVQNVFTVLKLAALGTLIAVGLQAAAAGSTVRPDWTLPPADAGLLRAMGMALVFVLWTYGGWTEAAYVAEEVQDPTRTVPRAILGGVALTTVLYLLVNLTYLLFIPVERLRETPLVASAVMEGVWGRAGAVFIAVMIACSAFGALNGYILTGGRILYAMGQDHALFNRLGTVHPRFRTPVTALWANAAIAVGLVCTKTLDQIMTYSQTVISVFFTLAVAGVIILRRRQPHLPRPYRAWGYPWTPILFILSMVWFIGAVALEDPMEVGFGVLLLLLGIPLYWWSQARPSSH